MAGINRVTVLINGVRYPIRTAEDPAYVTKLAAEMDEALRELMGTSGLSVNEALVLMGLEYLDCYRRADRNLDNMRNQIAGYLEDAAKARMEAGELKREMERLERTLQNKKDAKI